MKKTNKGFSLVELIIVIAIMAILIGVLAPQYIKYVEKSRVSSDQDNADNFLNAAMTACTDEEYINTIDQTDTVVFSGSTPSATDGMKEALDEYFANWSTASAKSKSYKDKTYTITITQDANSALKASGTWD